MSVQAETTSTSLNSPDHGTAGSSHNNLRISRILKCLSIMGLEHLNSGFLLHVLNEQSEHNELNSPGIRSSMDRWWANCIRNDEERDKIGTMIRTARNGEDGYIFTRSEYEKFIEDKVQRQGPETSSDVPSEGR